MHSLVVLAIAVSSLIALAAPAFADRAWQSPSGNIVCHYYASPGIAVCTTMNDGLVTLVDRSGAVAKGANQGTFNYGRGPTVPYGHSIVFANFACDSLSTGMVCIERRSCHGFFIARGVHFVSKTSCAGLSGSASTSAPSVPAVPLVPATPSVPAIPAVPSLPPVGVVGYPVVCADGWVSSSGGKSGACSHHGGELGGLPKLPAVGGGGLTWVNGYVRRDGTYVQGYYRR